MADLNARRATGPGTARDTSGLSEADLRQGMELLFYAYRDFTGEADRVLSDYGFGRAHHRALYFVGRNPGVTVGELIAILKITKQSLSRVLSSLVAQGFIAQRPDPEDGRRRRLTLTAKGEQLERDLAALQIDRMAAAYRRAGADAVRGFRAVLMGIVDEEHRKRVLEPGTAGNGATRTHPRPTALQYKTQDKNQSKSDPIQRRSDTRHRR